MDDIQRKLRDIDRLLSTRPADVLDKAVESSPLLFAAIGLVLGILAQSTLHLSVWLWLGFLLIPVTTTVLLLLYRHRLSSMLPLLMALCFFAASGCLGAVRLCTFKYLPPGDISRLVGRQGQLAEIR